MEAFRRIIWPPSSWSLQPWRKKWYVLTEHGNYLRSDVIQLTSSPLQEPCISYKRLLSIFLKVCRESHFGHSTYKPKEWLIPFSTVNGTLLQCVHCVFQKNSLKVSKDCLGWSWYSLVIDLTRQVKIPKFSVDLIYLLFTIFKYINVTVVERNKMCIFAVQKCIIYKRATYKKIKLDLWFT
jgi:hypothetical protein